jgi:hypothetical protein
VDRLLGEDQMKELRALSSRARITRSSFVNSYSWGDFKGNPRSLMEKYFDAFLYLANWGTHWFMLRVPCRFLSLEVARRYCTGDSASARETEDFVILDFQSQDESGEWVEEDDDLLSSMLQVRTELLSGDLRFLYLAWLLSAQEGEFEEDDLEPPVPPNLGDLSAALASFAEFLRIDYDLVAAAAKASPTANRDSASKADLEAWVEELAPREKDRLLLRVIDGDDPHLGAELRQRFERERRSSGEDQDDAGRRTVGELLQAAEEHAEERRHLETEQRARKEAKRERARLAARKKHLKSLRGKASNLWGQISRLIATKQSKRYDDAVSLLQDLRDLAEMEQESGEFSLKINALYNEHSRKPSLIKKFKEAGLVS